MKRENKIKSTVSNLDNTTTTTLWQHELHRLPSDYLPATRAAGSNVDIDTGPAYSRRGNNRNAH